MKVFQLLENDQEPLITTILQNALAKGKAVEVYYNNNGGRVASIDWESSEPPDHPDGITFFQLAADNHRWVGISDHNIERLEVVKQVNNGTEVLVLKQKFTLAHNGLDEQSLQEKVKGKPPEWAAGEQAALRELVHNFGFQLLTLKPERSDTMKGTNDMYIGGELKDKQKDNETGLPFRIRLTGLHQALAAHLLKKAKEDRYVKVFTKSWWRHDPHYIFPEDTLRAAINAVSATVVPTFEWDDYDKSRPELFVWYSISEPRK